MTAEAVVLRLALVAGPNLTLEDWQDHLIQQLASDPRFRLEGRLDPAGMPAPPALPWPVRMVMRLENRAAARWIGPSSRGAGQAVLNALPALAVADGLDAAIGLGAGDLPDAVREALPYGELKLRAGGFPIGFAPVMVGRSPGLIPIEVLAQRKGPAECVGRFRFDPKVFSSLTAAYLGEKAVLALKCALVDLASGRSRGGGTEGPVTPPRSADLPAYLTRTALRIGRRLAASLRHRLGRPADHWELAAGTGDATSFDPATSTSLSRASFAMADPFLFDHDGKLYLFYEAYDRTDTKARIDVARLDGTTVTPLGTAMTRDTHLSFPFVFRDGEAIYMIPETQATRQLEVWRATGFPLQWELHATAFHGQCVADSFMIRHGGTWWLFTNLSEHRRFQDHSCALYLYSCDGPSLTGLRPHPQNPVVVGTDMARNAGSVVSVGGRMFRPAQENRNGVYGYGLRLMEIESLTEQRYHERPYAEFSPETLPGWTRLHHVTFCEGRFVLDRSLK